MIAEIEDTGCPLHAEERDDGMTVVRCLHRGAVSLVVLDWADAPTIAQSLGDAPCRFTECQVALDAADTTAITALCASGWLADHQAAWLTYLALIRARTLPLDDTPDHPEVVAWARAHGWQVLRQPYPALGGRR